MNHMAAIKKYPDVHARLYGLPLPADPRQRDFIRVASPPAPPTITEMMPVLIEMVAAFTAAKKEREEHQQLPVARQIISETCAAYGVPQSDIFARRRYPDVINCKHEIMWRIRYGTRLNDAQISRLLGMYHNSVAYGVRRHQARIDAGEAIAPGAAVGVAR